MHALARSFHPIIHVLGYVLMIFAAAMLVPLAFALAGGEETAQSYDLAFLITMGSAIAMVLLTGRFSRELKARDGFLLVTLAWTVLPAFATLPLLLCIQGLGFTHAYFEAMSGLTTTGATVLSGLDRLPLSINVWRHLLVWLGGMGILVLAVAILPLLASGGVQLFRAEATGPMKDAKLTPRIADTAKALYAIYLGLSFVCFIAYAVAGMSWSDAFMHMCATMGLGGFSSHDGSFGHWDSPWIEGVAIVFMTIAGINFMLHFVALRRRTVAVYWRDPEARAYLFTLVAAALGVSLFLWWRDVYTDFATALRYGVFNTVSVVTTTGFSNTDYNQWPIFAPVLMLFLAGYATNSGSPGGGIKTVRALILLKQAKREMTRILHPQAVSPVTIGGDVVENRVIFAVLAFMLVYGGAVIWLTFMLLLSGLDVISAFTAIVACINNTGPGLNQVGPASTYAALSDFELWVCTFAMLIGRLELFAVLVVLTPAFWRK
jgi:trk system potassium uptake protein TrkH